MRAAPSPLAADLARLVDELGALLAGEPPLPGLLAAKITKARQSAAEARDLAFLIEPLPPPVPPPDGDPRDLDHIV